VTFENDGKPNKSMDVRARAATLSERHWLNPKLRVFGFAPRHLNRSTAFFENNPAHRRSNPL
jgi:hypothetical protein